MLKSPLDLENYEYKKVNSRAVGKNVPFSVAIAIAIESHLIKEKLDYKAVYINAKTAYRAYHGSYADADRPSKQQVTQGFVEELESIKSFIEQLGYYVNVYIPLYGKIKTTFPDANAKKPETPKQRIYADWEYTGISAANDAGVVDQVVNYNIAGYEADTVMITHMPIDLLNQYRFTKLDLLETHSGTIKEKSEWNTKLGIDRKIAPKFPFNIFTLQVFGDGSKSFGSIREIKQKKAIIQLAADKKWTSYTTLTKIKHDIKTLEKDMVDRFSRMLSIKLKN